MSEDPLANKRQPPSALPDAEYDVIYATVSETAQGRRFLEEYARRRRPTETEATLATIERMQAAIRHGGASERLEILLEIADMAQAIVQLRAEILAMKPSGAGQLDATEELDSIVHTTENATSRILAAAEQVQEIAWTMRESGSIEALCDELDKQATEIYTACTFQDLTGQRTRKVIQVLRYLEDRINAMVTAREKEIAEQATAGDPSSSSLMQAGVDAVMQPGAASDEERQDATLEDISRLMLAIEPMIGLQQAAAEAHRAADEVRPELSVAETVMAETDSAHALADWAVNPAVTPAKPASEEAAPLADWVVEDSAAAQPESEPAWMILRRMEAELDELRQTEAPPPVPAAPSSRGSAEPTLFAAEPMAQLAQRLQPDPLLPPAELFRSNPASLDSLAELETAMAAVEMKLLQSDDDAERPAAAPEPMQSASAAAAAPPEPPASSLTQRAAATGVEPRPPAAARMEDTLAAEGDADDFLFAPEKTAQEPARRKAAAEESGPPVVEWEGGTFPDPALVTPKTLPPPQADAEEHKADARASYDPLAPLRAMSDAEKIALFS
jgi:chemotaxis regulatin CheY-phosphate phosphatase CheZ